MSVVDGTRPAAGDASARDYTARVLSLDGRVIVAVAGIALVALGIVMAIRGFGAEFTRHLQMGWMSRGTQGAVVRLGQAGYVARGVVIAGIGIAALDAAVTYDAAKAKASTGRSARSPSRPSVRGCSSWSHWADRVRDRVVPRGEVAPHPWRSPCLNTVCSSGGRGHAIAPPYAVAHCAAWPAAAVVSQPSRFDIACAQVTTARTWPESSAARHRTDHG
jgi:hypothetical protein